MLVERHMESTRRKNANKRENVWPHQLLQSLIWLGFGDILQHSCENLSNGSCVKEEEEGEEEEEWEVEEEEEEELGDLVA